MTRQESGQYAALCRKCYSMGIPKPERPNTVQNKVEKNTPIVPLTMGNRPGRVTMDESDLKEMYNLAQENYEQAHSRLCQARRFDRFNQLVYMEAKEEVAKAEKVLDRLWMIRLHSSH